MKMKRQHGNGGGLENREEPRFSRSLLKSWTSFDKTSPWLFFKSTILTFNECLSVSLSQLLLMDTCPNLDFTLSINSHQELCQVFLIIIFLNTTHAQAFVNPVWVTIVTSVCSPCHQLLQLRAVLSSAARSFSNAS